MAGSFDKHAQLYSDVRPTYPREWFSMLAKLTTHHSLAWDVGTGNGQAAVRVAEHYEKVIATDIGKDLLRHAQKHPGIQYFHTPLSMSDEELVSIAGGDNSVDLITVATAVHWFDLPRFYSIANRVLRKPGGIIAVWSYAMMSVSPEFDQKMKSFLDSTQPYWHSNILKFVFGGYKTLPFPFESVGLGSEGEPIQLEMKKEVSFEGFLGWLKSWSATVTAKEKGVDLLTDKLVKEIQEAWGEPKLVRPVVYNTFMLVGKVKV
ncbi:putative methyltransferase DDB [Capsicum annuum]|uniref:putative methyltransferase DDB_G0268948 n=1 Tax=Capsicum annuum TaxID=4072 RepID=UPI0007BF65F0|nr:putative methyltransferase DDB_G0268948 [Capsicum annuum]